MPQISSTVDHATFSTAPLRAFGESSISTAAMLKETNPTSTSNASATTISETMPTSVRILSRSSSGTASAVALTAPPAIGFGPAPAFSSSRTLRWKRPLLTSSSSTSSPGSTRWPISLRPPNRKNATKHSSRLKTNELANSSIEFSARSSRSTTPLTIEPNTLIGEKPPAVAPLMTNRPISTGLIPYWMAKPSAIGATIATAPGTTAPEAVRTAVIRKKTQGIAIVRPLTALTEAWISQSTVPLFEAMPNSSVTPTRITNRSPGNPAKMSSSDTPSAVPRPNAATTPSTPMLIPIVVAMRNTPTSTRIEINSLDMRTPPLSLRGLRRPDQLHRVPGPPPHPVADLLPARHARRCDERPRRRLPQRREQP